MSNYDFLNHIDYSGIRARPITFMPQTSKLVSHECQGVHILVTDLLQLDAFSLGVKIIAFLKKNYPRFEWIKTNKKKDYFIDYLMGTDMLRHAVDQELPDTQILKEISGNS